jgi:hypothetical protein
MAPEQPPQLIAMSRTYVWPTSVAGASEDMMNEVVQITRVVIAG